jgi:hypothetical protein
MFGPSRLGRYIILRVKRREIEEQTNKSVREKSLSTAEHKRIYFHAAVRKSLGIWRRKQQVEKQQRVAFLAGKSIKPIR